MAFIGIKVPPGTARLLSGIDISGEKEGTNELHITILCFEENWPISEISKALEAAYKVVSKIKPFIVTVDSVGCFPKREDKPCPIIAKVKSKELNDLNEKLKKQFDKDKIDYSKKFKDYKPHITLSYDDKEIEEFKIDNMDFSVSEIVLWGGDHGDDRIFITFPLRGPEKQKKALLIQKANMFCKIANNPPHKYLTSSFERRKFERIIIAQENHYKYDPSVVSHWLERFSDKKINQETFDEYGAWDKHSFKIIPIDDIEYKEVWDQSKIPPLLNRMQKNLPIDPVMISERDRGGKWVITDGIHRIAVSKMMGYTHIPAFVTEWITTPPPK